MSRDETWKRLVSLGVVSGDMPGGRWELQKAILYAANFIGANLEGAKLVEANLFTANLERAIFKGANLEGANLEGANLFTANLERAIFKGANLEGANLEGANLTGVIFKGASLRGTNLSHCNLEGSNFKGFNLEGANLTGANLEGANLEGANLTGVNLTGVIFKGASLRGANLSHCNLEGFNFEGFYLENANLYGVDLSGAKCFRANFKNANCEKTQFVNADLRQTIFAKATLTDASLSNAKLGGTNLRAANLTRADLQKADLVSNNLRETNLTKADLREANLTKADLRKADVTSANLKGATLTGAKIEGVNLTRANLENTNFSTCNFVGCNLQYINLSGANLQTANLINVKLDGATLTDTYLYETQRDGWNIEGVICERASWDAGGKIFDEYEPGEFERLYSASFIEIEYPDGIKEYQYHSFPYIIGLLGKQFGDKCNLQFKSLEQGAGKNKIKISVTNIKEGYTKEDIEAPLKYQMKEQDKKLSRLNDKIKELQSKHYELLCEVEDYRRQAGQGLIGNNRGPVTLPLAVLFADSKGFSKRSNDKCKETMDFLEKHCRPYIDKYNGIMPNTWGDAFKAGFEDPANGVKCALEMQKIMSDLDYDMRIGMHHGDVELAYSNLKDGLDGKGKTLSIAARLEPLCKPGKVLISKELYFMLYNNNEFFPEEVELKLKKDVGELKAGDPIKAYYVKYANALKHP